MNSKRSPLPFLWQKSKIQCRVSYYEGQQYSLQLDLNSNGQELLNRVFTFLGIEECDFFGLTTVINEMTHWVEPNKPLRKQIGYDKKDNDKEYVFTLKVS